MIIPTLNLFAVLPSSNGPRWKERKRERNQILSETNDNFTHMVRNRF